MLCAPLLAAFSFAQEPSVPGERIPAHAISGGVLESMDVVLERERNRIPDKGTIGLWNGQDGRWLIPPETANAPTHSGNLAVINEWGDPRMGIGFGRMVDVRDLWLAGQGASAAPNVRVVGFVGGQELVRTAWLGLGSLSTRIQLDFVGVDRIEVQVTGVSDARGFFALDDLAFANSGTTDWTTLDFEDLHPRMVVSGSGYAGLEWESGHGFRRPIPDPAIVAPLTIEDDVPVVEDGGAPQVVTGLGPTPPRMWNQFIAASRGDPGAGFIPPDSCGAVGPNHYVSVVNTNLSAFRKDNGQRVLNVTLNSFWGSTGTTGDPRAVFDPHSQRFVLLATNFSGGATIFLAVSATDDPTGAWFKFQFQTDQGVDAGRWPDYPTLGVDARGIYSAAYMVGGTARMTIWAIDKAPLVSGTPSVGTITAFRTLPFEGAIQPATTYGDPGGEYLVSRRSSTLLRVRRVNSPLTAPTLSETGSVTIPSHSSPPTAPALGSSPNLNALDTRPMNAVFRDGSLWTIHGVSSGGKAALRWYELRVSPLSLGQQGTITDSVWHYHYGSIAVDADGNVGVGMSGSHAGAWPSTFVTGRKSGDPLGQMATPQLAKPGEGPINHVDGANRNRYGDYSHINVDPVDDRGFWTIQEYGGTSNLWRTWVTRFGYETSLYGDGLAGTLGVPSLDTTGLPQIGQLLTIRMGNSSGTNGAGAVLLAGLASASTPILGGTLLVNSIIGEAHSLAAPFGDSSFTLPNDPNLVGSPIFFQTAQIDAAAPQGIAFSRGLEVRPATR